MKRRTLLMGGLLATLGRYVSAAVKQDRLDDAVAGLSRAVSSGQVAAATLHVAQGDFQFSRHFGGAKSDDAKFLLGSISKPICVTALMGLYDQKQFALDDRLSKLLPDFQGEQRGDVTLQHLLTHTSGLPDQLAENDRLRRAHAPLSEFVAHAVRTPLQFAPGTRYQYSSMGILLATHVAERIAGQSILDLVDRTVFKPLGMTQSAQGLGRFRLEELVPAQTEFAAPEAGAGDPSAKSWDWNSPYWRALGAPWGGTHASAGDIARWLREFLELRGKAVTPETARLMIRNHNPAGLTPRGLGFNVGNSWSGVGCSDRTFGHTGSTGTIAWADPATNTICVVLTSLPARAVTPHPRDQAAGHIAAAVQ